MKLKVTRNYPVGVRKKYLTEKFLKVVGEK